MRFEIKSFPFHSESQLRFLTHTKSKEKCQVSFYVIFIKFINKPLYYKGNKGHFTLLVTMDKLTKANGGKKPELTPENVRKLCCVLAKVIQLIISYTGYTVYSFILYYSQEEKIPIGKRFVRNLVRISNFISSGFKDGRVKNYNIKACEIF